jgi:hypothetical protein
VSRSTAQRPPLPPFACIRAPRAGAHLDPHASEFEEMQARSAALVLLLSVEAAAYRRAPRSEPGGSCWLPSSPRGAERWLVAIRRRLDSRKEASIHGGRGDHTAGQVRCIGGVGSALPWLPGRLSAGHAARLIAVNGAN